MKRFLYAVMLFAVACTQPYYAGVDNPHQGGGTSVDRNIIGYIDTRLQEEYYWLDEVEEKSNQFNRNVEWERYLDNALMRLTTNVDDGYVNGKGQRVFYSYIRENKASTRSGVEGFGIALHYTIVVIDSQNSYYGFVVESVYKDSPAEAAGVKRGDVITKVNNGYITANNYNTLFMMVENNGASSVNLMLRRQTTNDTYKVELQKGSYEENTVAHYEVIELEDKRIGYLVYTAFESEYEDELIEAIETLKSAGVEEFILDLRVNRGGSVPLAVKLCSALVPASLESQTLCSLVRNKRNTKSDAVTVFELEDTGSILSLDNLTVICSGYTASASELVIMGLRGLDFPVTLIGSTTEGKNCGMDVTRKTINGISVEFAPITFMCLNAKGDGNWGDGVNPDVDLTSEGNEFGVSDKNYPIPRTEWGDYNSDIALAVALAKITGKGIVQASTRSVCSDTMEPVVVVPKPVVGACLYRNE